MDELKLLVEMVANLPNMALWVIAFFFIYKVSIIGSIYGVIRLAIQRAYEWGVARKTLPAIQQEINLADKLRGIYITSDETLNLLTIQLQRVRGKNVSRNKILTEQEKRESYIHERSVDWLREAIDAKEMSERYVDSPELRP